MTPAQQAKYFAEWGKLRDVLRARGLSHEEIEHERHKITRKALGRHKSSKDFTNGDLDAVLRVMAAVRDPAGFDEQMRLQDSPERALDLMAERCRRAVKAILPGHEDSLLSLQRHRYLETTAKRITGTAWEHLNAEQMRKVMGALERSARVRRQTAQKQAEKNPF